MKKIKELNVKDLKNECEIEDFKFKKTTELEPFNGIIGQERAMNAIKTAMQIPQKGFNLYLCGSIGIGKTAYALSVVNNLAKINLFQMIFATYIILKIQMNLFQ